MPPVPLALTSGAYNAKSYIANCQRCVNLYPEGNPEESKAPVQTTHYLAPGLTQLGSFGQLDQVRCLYTTFAGALYGVCGNNVYYIPPSFQPQLLGTMGSSPNQVKMRDNGTQLLIVDGTANGYQVDLSSNVMSSVSAANNSGTNGFAFYGANNIDFIDGYIIGNVPGKPQWWSSANLSLAMDPLSFGGKAGGQDPILGVFALQRNVWLGGAKAIELHSDVGGANFPFALQQGPYIEQGCVAPYSFVPRVNEGMAWISQNTQGNGILLFGEGYKADRKSNNAIENEWQSYGDLSDTVGFAWQTEGHLFCGWRFPTANKTWIWDASTGQFHERVTTGPDGKETMWRVNCVAYAYGMHIAGDHSNGLFYKIDPDNPTDNGVPIFRRRGFPHIVNALTRTKHNGFRLDLEVGAPSYLKGLVDVPLTFDNPAGNPFWHTEPADGNAQMYRDPLSGSLTSGVPERKVWLRWSNDRGKTWGIPVARDIGDQGQYGENLFWPQLGMARDRVYEVFWAHPFVTALNGAFLTPTPGMS